MLNSHISHIMPNIQWNYTTGNIGAIDDKKIRTIFNFIFTQCNDINLFSNTKFFKDNI